MSREFTAGDVLVFQVEAGYALLQVLGVDGEGDGRIWHIAAFRDYFPDVEFAEAAAANIGSMARDIPHIALTERAFASTQVARLANVPLTDADIGSVSSWRSSADPEVSDRSIRLLLGIR